MTEHLSPLDATFLELEEADAAAHMHIGAVMVFDPGPHGDVPELAAVRADLAARLSAVPRFRQRLSAPVTGGLTWPAWEEDPAFDVAAHVRRAALPGPGGEAQLMDWVADFWSHRLDRGRPLWEMVLLEGLQDGRWALVTKTHHAMVDGVGSVDVGHVLLDAEPTPRKRPTSARPATGSGAAPRTGHGPRLWALPGAVAHTAWAGLQAVLDPASLREALRRSRALAELLARDELVAAPASSLNRPIGKARRFAVVRAPLKDLKLVKRELGGTINDVALAVVTGGLRELLLDRGEEPPAAGVRAMVPVNIRAGAEQLALGNRITSLFVHLPVAAETPLERYARTLEETASLKRGDQALGGRTLLQLTTVAPPVLHATLARSLFATRLFNVTVTNVPGPQGTLYGFGAPMREVFGLVPLAADHDVGIAILSYDGGVTFGVNADRGTAGDLDVLLQGMETALGDLRRTARAARRAQAGASR